MEIRLAEEKDLPEIYTLGFATYQKEREMAARKFNPVINEDKIKATVAYLVNSKTVYIAQEGTEIIGAMIGAILLSIFSDEAMFTSIFFFVKEGYRNLTKEIILRIEELLGQAGITKFIISHSTLLNGEKQGRFYQMLGYELFEQHFIKSIGRLEICQQMSIA